MLYFFACFSQRYRFTQCTKFMEITKDFDTDGFVQATYTDRFKTIITDQFFDFTFDGCIVGGIEEYCFFRCLVGCAS
ncbi:hypothetical protein SAMN05444008_101205 [Cnuella takakiae]|uniref:Uncharacterized protein n=2 Tax=Cnuella takakiae TaxID=1302690 RepID=A0A1M4SRJ7_9BACT|nr:hypothetical protein SAMN05444008_101205 [Cnuella takakiae]